MLLSLTAASLAFVPRSPLPQLGPSFVTQRYAVMSEKKSINDDLLAAEAAWAAEAPTSAAAKKLAASTPGIGLAATQITVRLEESATASPEDVTAEAQEPAAAPPSVEDNAAALADGASNFIDTFMALGNLFFTSSVVGVLR